MMKEEHAKVERIWYKPRLIAKEYAQRNVLISIKISILY